MVPFLSPKAKGSGDPPRSRPGCFAYPDMLEVGRMPEHNEAESRSHFSAWSIVSAPLVLGFDLADDAKVAAAWPIISNKEALAISQTWIQSHAFPSGKLLKHWQAPNAPTLVVRGGCSQDGCRDDEEQCSKWAKDDQCLQNPGYMHQHCRKSCSRCDPKAFFDTWAFRATGTGGGGGGGGTLSPGGDLCLDTRGQLPGGHSGGNVMHVLPCDSAPLSNQNWTFNATGGVLQAPHAVGAPCLRVFDTWLWSVPIVTTLSHGCNDLKPQRNEQWTLHPNGTLQNAQYGCVEVSRTSGPPTTIWAKPLEGGRLALLAINGADLPQTVELDFRQLLLEGGMVDDDAPQEWEVRDVWMAASLGARTNLQRRVPPHDCVLLVLSPGRQ